MNPESLRHGPKRGHVGLGLPWQDGRIQKIVKVDIDIHMDGAFDAEANAFATANISHRINPRDRIRALVPIVVLIDGAIWKVVDSTPAIEDYLSDGIMQIEQILRLGDPMTNDKVDLSHLLE